MSFKLRSFGLLAFHLSFILSMEVSAQTGGAIYHFDEGSGTRATDSSGAGNDAQISGATYVTGFSGKALHFRKGQQDNVLVPQRVFNGFSSTAYFQAMIRPGSYPGICGTDSALATIFRKRGDYNDWELEFFNDGSLGAVLWDNPHFDNVIARTKANVVSLNVWTKVAMWYDGSAMRIYVNDTLVATMVKALTVDWVRNYTGTQIGNNTFDGNCDYSFDGDIDEVIISPRNR